MEIKLEHFYLINPSLEVGKTYDGVTFTEEMSHYKYPVKIVDSVDIATLTGYKTLFKISADNCLHQWSQQMFKPLPRFNHSEHVVVRPDLSMNERFMGLGVGSKHLKLKGTYATIRNHTVSDGELYYKLVEDPSDAWFHAAMLLQVPKPPTIKVF